MRRGNSRFEFLRVRRSARLIRLARGRFLFSTKGKGRGIGVEKAAKRRQEVEIVDRRVERGKGKDRAGSGAALPRAVCTIFFASRQRRPESRCFLG